MAKTTTSPFTQAIRNEVQTLVNADGAIGVTYDYGTAPPNTKLLCAAGAEGAVVKSLTVASSDTVIHVLQFFLSLDSGTTQYLIGSVAIPVNSGNATSATVAVVNFDVLHAPTMIGLPIDNSGRNVLSLAANARIYVGTTVIVNANRTIYATATLEDF